MRDPCVVAASHLRRISLYFFLAAPNSARPSRAMDAGTGFGRYQKREYPYFSINADLTGPKSSNSHPGSYFGGKEEVNKRTGQGLLPDSNDACLMISIMSIVKNLF